MADEKGVASEGGVKGATSLVTSESELFSPFFGRAVRAAIPRQPGRSDAGRETSRPSTSTPQEEGWFVSPGRPCLEPYGLAGKRQPA